LGKARTASWLAFGIRQELDTIKGRGWQSMTYVGIGRESTPNTINPIDKPAIIVLNQEFYHQFHNNWQYSFALSYRNQDEYIDSIPFSHDTPGSKQEFRTYARLSYLFKNSRLKFTPTLRQEFRKYYSPNFHSVSENFQLRTRFRLQLKINLDLEQVHRLVLSSEQLFSVSQYNSTNKWGGYDYRESIFCIYYSYSPKNSPFIFNLGYMNNLVGKKAVYDVHYVAFDIIVENPFKLKQRNKELIQENLE
jgi:hypothetical protein